MIHPLIITISSFIHVGLLLFSSPSISTFIVVILHSLICLISGIKFKKLISLYALVVLLSLSIFILNYIYATKELAYLNLLRTSQLTFVSMSSALMIDFELLILFLMQRKWLTPTHGYPFFVAINSISHLGEEKKRLKHLMKLRGLNSFKERLYMIIPLLVFAIRHSQRAATAMVARGLNDNKVFHNDYGLKKKDLHFFGLFLLIHVLLFILVKK